MVSPVRKKQVIDSDEDDDVGDEYSDNNDDGPPIIPFDQTDDQKTNLKKSKPSSVNTSGHN